MYFRCPLEHPGILSERETRMQIMVQKWTNLDEGNLSARTAEWNTRISVRKWVDNE